MAILCGGKLAAEGTVAEIMTATGQNTFEDAFVKIVTEAQK